MYIKKRQNLFAIFVAMVMVFAMMLITTGTVYAEEQMEPIEIINECGEEGELLIQDPVTGMTVTQSAAESEILITFLGGKQLDPSDPNYNEPDPDTNSKPIYLIATAIATGEELYNAQIGHNEMVVIRIPHGGAKVRLSYDSGSDEVVDISGATVTGISDKSYTGKALTQSPTVKVGDVTLKSGTDYTLSYSNNIRVGTATVDIKGTGAFTGSIKKTFKINAKAIKPAVSLSKTAYTYTGKVIKPTVTVKDGSSKLAASNYSVTYAKGRKNVGIYKVTVKMKGNYSGSKTVSFQINPKGTSISKLSRSQKAFTTIWKKQPAKMASKYITGYQLQYSQSNTFKSGNKVVSLTGYKKTSRKISGLKAKTKYFVRVRTYMKVGSSTLYSPWSKVKAVTTPAPKVVKKAASAKRSTVYWTPNGTVYHLSKSCSTLSRSKTIHSGTIAQSGKPRVCKVCGN